MTACTSWPLFGFGCISHGINVLGAALSICTFLSSCCDVNARFRVMLKQEVTGQSWSCWLHAHVVESLQHRVAVVIRLEWSSQVLCLVSCVIKCAILGIILIGQWTSFGVHLMSFDADSHTLLRSVFVYPSCRLYLSNQTRFKLCERRWPDCARSSGQDRCASVLTQL